MKKGWAESRWRRVARFRLGNEMRESKYWEEKERKEFKRNYVEEIGKHGNMYGKIISNGEKGEGNGRRI